MIKLREDLTPVVQPRWDTWTIPAGRYIGFGLCKRGHLAWQWSVGDSEVTLEQHCWRCATL